MPPDYRFVGSAYDGDKSCPNHFNVSYPRDYEDNVRRITSSLREASQVRAVRTGGIGDAGIS